MNQRGKEIVEGQNNKKKHIKKTNQKRRLIGISYASHTHTHTLTHSHTHTHIIVVIISAGSSLVSGQSSKAEWDCINVART